MSTRMRTSVTIRVPGVSSTRPTFPFPLCLALCSLLISCHPPQDEQCSPKLSSNNNNKTTSRLPAAHLNGFTMSELKL